MADLVEEYIADMPQIVKVLESAITNADWQELQRQAHRIKGSAGGYGFPSVSVAAGALEIALSYASPEKISERTTRLLVLCRRIRSTRSN